MLLFCGLGWERGMWPWAMVPFGTSLCRVPQHPQQVSDPDGCCGTASPKGCTSWVMNIFNFQKMERPHSLSNLAGDSLLFQKNIQAL